MSDWKIGDLALCVVDIGYWLGLMSNARREGPAKNSVYRVTGVTHDGEGLRFAEFPVSYERTSFRKIRPDEHEDCEPEFVELLNRSKPKVPAPLSEEGVRP